MRIYAYTVYNVIMCGANSFRNTVPCSMAVNSFVVGLSNLERYIYVVDRTSNDSIWPHHPNSVSTQNNTFKLVRQHHDHGQIYIVHLQNFKY